MVLSCRSGFAPRSQESASKQSRRKAAPTVIFVLFLCMSGLFAEIPDSPTGLLVVPESGSSFLLGWMDNADDETGFRIERRLSGGDWLVAGYTTADETTFLSTGCYAYSNYEHRIVASNEDGESVSDAIQARTLPLLNQRRARLIESSSARQGEGSFLELSDGTLEIWYSDMATVSDLAEARISKKTSKDGGLSWSDPIVVFAEKGMALFLPSILRMESGEIALSYARRIPGDWFSKRVVRISGDEGGSWSDEIDVTDGAYDYQTGSHDRFYRLSNGDLIILVHALEGTPARPHHFVTDVYGSTDNGRSWERWTKESLDVPLNPYSFQAYGFWECSLAALVDGELLMYGRNATGWMHECRSNDHGRTWTTPAKTTLRSPVAPSYIKNIPGTDTLLLLGTPMFYPDKKFLGLRYVLSSRISDDGGKTWRNYKEIEYHSHDWWYEYPHVLFSGDFVHMAYRAIELRPDKSWSGDFVQMARVHLGYNRLPLVWFTE